MKFISAEEFSKQPKEVQKVFKEWWKVELGDLYCESCPTDLFSDERINVMRVIDYNCDEYGKSLLFTMRNFKYPLFTESQLREFIEDKTNSKIETVWFNEILGYSIDLVDKHGDILLKRYEDLGTDLLKVYWKVACIVTGEISNE